MSQHRVTFEYAEPRWGTLEMDMDPDWDLEEKEAIAFAEIREVYDDIIDIDIKEIVEL